MKITSADAWVSRCIREGADNICERCKTDYRGRRGLNCCHYEGRDSQAVRTDPINLFCMCMGCHRHMDEHKVEFHEFYLELKGQSAYDVLVEKTRNITLAKQNKRELKEIAKHYKAEHKRILDERSTGKTGRIEVIGY